MKNIKLKMIETLELEPLPGEGGFFKRTYCSNDFVEAKTLSGKLVKRPRSTSILFLVGGEDFSALHKLEFDEVFSFSDGEPCKMFLIDDKGSGHTVILGRDLAKGEKPHFTVPAGWLQGLRSIGEWSLVSASMSPGFDYEDFSMPNRTDLLKKYPNLKDDIKKYTR